MTEEKSKNLKMMRMYPIPQKDKREKEDAESFIT